MRVIVGAFYRAILSVCPQNSWGDSVVAWFAFVGTHGRLPRNRPYFNDVLHRIKTSGELRNPERVFTSDKELVKLYVQAKAGDQYNVPTIAVLRSPEEVDRFEFPDQCCIKPTQASGVIMLRRQGEPIDREEIKRWFKLDYYKKSREINYRDLRPKVMVEPLLFGGKEVRDYKFFCVNGAVKMVQVDLERYGSHRRALLDRNWTMQDFALGYPVPEATPDSPANYAEMVEVAEKLAAAFDFVRVDLYSDGETCLVGEITHCHGSARRKFSPVTAEKVAGDLLFGPAAPTPIRQPRDSACTSAPSHTDTARYG